MGVSRDASFSYTPKIINGGVAGIVGVSCVFPLDLVKTRLQNQRPDKHGKLQYSGILDCAKKTWHSGGASVSRRFFGMYSGSGVNILLITPEKAIKLVANDLFRHKLAVEGKKNLPAFRGMIAGGLAGLFQIIVTTPMSVAGVTASWLLQPATANIRSLACTKSFQELLKVQLQQGGGKKQTATQLALSLVREKGIAGLYRGIWPTMARDVSFSVIYFPLFAKLDSLGPRKNDGSGDAAFYASFVAGILAGAVASLSVTPLDVIKTRMQMINNAPGVEPYKGLADAFMKIFDNEGPRALFKGGGTRMLVMAPLFGIAQMVYYIGVAESLLGIKKTQHV